MDKLGIRIAALYRTQGMHSSPPLYIGGLHRFYPFSFYDKLTLHPVNTVLPEHWTEETTMLNISTLVAVLLYSTAGFLQWQVMRGDRKQSRTINQSLGLAGLVAHTFAIYLILHQPSGINLSLFSAGSLISWLVAGLVLLSSLRQSVDNLFIGVFPLAAVTALAALVTGVSDGKAYDAGLIAHILLSILAYSIFTIAALQAILLSRQVSALKHHHTRGLVSSLPPLQTMERLLFEMVWTGLILLSASLITGFIVFDDLFAQHLVHKTVLSIVAWCLYATLLFGRISFGWRSNTAVRWTIASFITLALGFFGSKMVIEWFV
ncbi:inner membrane protein YpjD [uncultured Neptuniibacter sp.]|uniref:cytochrome C assembly family protein n=1 Tax=uncultured Neptuniibacter sp. TaxID=502143 RepID=UPI00260E61C3|nr:cytochrome c biogenesis protein CcsA [uncultured Neptuniibacter sp.]